jgi:hypothetical protein
MLNQRLISAILGFTGGYMVNQQQQKSHPQMAFT